jgi:hypothetical protein
MPKTTKTNHYLAIHGHFYQPPRENPWLGLIERQDSAFPAHDWNERIAMQCYCPNARAHILDPESKIETLFNNYIHMNFNFGPTLFSWLAVYHPKTYRRILKADKVGQELNGGHGNAIAQAYNHMIMPLANIHDKYTQIIWGIADFKYHFGRDPEGMWLPETAVNYETVHLLIEHNIKYIILAPTQAEKVSPLGKNEWHDVSNNSINPRQPYRVFEIDHTGRKNYDRYLDVFFYDGQLSIAVSFEHLLRSAPDFSTRVHAAFDAHYDGPQLVNIATDGESYGHHEPYGEMGLAYLFYKELKKRNIQPINHGYYLELFPPHYEAELKRGPNNEGTSWSCFHGVGRWYRNCSCTTGGEHWWNQEWRTPLRNAFNELRVKLDQIFENEGRKYIKDVWHARNRYIAVILTPTELSKDEFLREHCHDNVSTADHETVWTLLEMQRYGMYLLTSCAWFFADVSGMEAVQNMCYAKKALDLGQRFTDADLEGNLLSILSTAKSNHPYLDSGKEAYERYVLPQAYIEPKVVHSFVVSKMHDLPFSFPVYDVSSVTAESMQFHTATITIGKVKIYHYSTSETHYYFFALGYLNQFKLRCIVERTTLESDIAHFKASLPIDNKETMLALFQNKGYSLKDIPHEQRTQILHKILGDKEESFRKLFEDFYDTNVELLDVITESGVPLPNVLKAISEFVLTNRFSESFTALLSKYDFDCCSDAYLILNEAKKFGLTVDKSEAIRSMGNLIMAQLIKVEQETIIEYCDKLIEMLNFSKSVNFYFENGGKIINRIWRIMNTIGVPLVKGLADPVKDYSNYVLALKLIEIAEKVNFSAVQLKDGIKAFEAKLAGNPRERFS